MLFLYEEIPRRIQKRNSKKNDEMLQRQVMSKEEPMKRMGGRRNEGDRLMLLNDSFKML